jgi:hypothetical protein
MSTEPLPALVADTPTLRRGTIVRRLDDEAVVWSNIRREPARLDPVATVMLDVIDGLATTSELVDDIQAVLNIGHFEARARLKEVLRLFDDAGLLASSEPAETSLVERPLLPEPDW